MDDGDPLPEVVFKGDRHLVEEESDREIREDSECKELWRGAESLPLSPCKVEDFWVVHKPI